MDFTNRSAHHTTSHGSPGDGKSQNAGWHKIPGWLRGLWMLMLFAGTILVIAIVSLLYFGGPKQSSIVDESGVQAVFLDNDQVYFGDLVSINSQFFDLQNIYYLSTGNELQPNTQDQTGSIVSLEKLGCELHGPEDRMIINRDHVVYWENLKTDGKVTQEIQKWIDNNPRGLECDDSSLQASKLGQE